MTKAEIFEDIVTVMRQDASFCKDKAGGDAQAFRKRIRENMTDKEFCFTVNSFLATFRVAGHLFFYKKNCSNKVPFQMKCFRGELYVTKPCKGLDAGDKVLAADKVPVRELAAQHAEFFLGEPEERQGDRWAELLSYFDELTIQKADKLISFSPAGHRPIKQSSDFFQKLRNDIAYLRFDDFAEEAPIAKFIATHEQEICSSPNLVIDVRGNCGGTDTAFVPLLKYCLAERDTSCGKTVLPEERTEINYTARNVDERLWLLERYREVAEPKTTHLFDTIIERHKALRGKGFVPEEEALAYPNRGTELPARVFVLTDECCGSSGESFVQAVSPLEKVTVVGRPTMGILDYSCLAYTEYGNYMLAYPTSRRLAIDEGKAMSGKGVPVDVYVPWSPAFFEQDKDLERVFELIKNPT